MRHLFHKLIFCAAAALSAVAAIPHAHAESNDHPKPHREVWVQTTKPMLACEAIQDGAILPMSLAKALPGWKSTGAVEPPCEQLGRGDVLLLDDQQTEAETHVVVKLWRPVCAHGCSPAMTPVYAPSRNQVGVYLKPSEAPAGWR